MVYTQAMAVILQGDVKRVVDDKEADKLVEAKKAILIGYGNKMIKFNDYAIKKGEEAHKTQEADAKRQLARLEAERQKELDQIQTDSKATEMGRIMKEKERESNKKKAIEADNLAIAARDK